MDYNTLVKDDPQDVIPIKDKKGKEITIRISKAVTKDDLAKLKQGGHSIIFFAALKEKEKKEKETDKKKKQNDKFKDTNEAKFQFNTRYGKTHMRVDINKEYEEENKEDA